MKVLASVGLALLCATAALGASTSIVANGVLLGAQHVMVAGSAYTVMFTDGSCIQIFANCDPSQFAFHDFDSAKLAGQALLDQVLMDGPSGAFRSDPGKVAGCEEAEGPLFERECTIVTPFAIDSGIVSGSNAIDVMTVASVWPKISQKYKYADYSGQPTTCAIWTKESSMRASSPIMDFDANGISDILMRTASGDLSILLMDSSGAATTTNLGNVTTGWKIMGSADFNDDNKSDILWRNAAGDMVIWLMNGASITQGVYIGTVSMDWTIVAVRDFSGDGKADILWQDGNGALVLWMMNGTLLAGSTYLGTMPGGKVQ